MKEDMRQLIKEVISKKPISYVFYAAKLILFFLAYFITAKFGLKLGAVSGFATLVWPPTGIAIAGILFLGYKYWPAIFLAAFFVNLSTGAPLLVAVGIGLGNMFEALLGVFLLEKFGFHRSQYGLKNALLFILFCVVANTMLAATIGVSSLWLGGVVASSAYRATWLAWWVGDALGALIVGNLIITFKESSYFNNVTWLRIIELLTLFSLLIASSVIIFTSVFSPEIITTNNLILIYTIFPLLIWAALRFGPAGTSLAVFITSIISITGTVLGRGPFAVGGLSDNLLLLQGYIGVIAATSLILAAVIEERSSIDRAKSEFVSLASHQLRTPLTTMKWYSHSLLRAGAENLSEIQREYMREIYHNNERMIGMVNALLNVSRIELGTFMISPVPSNIFKIADEIIHDINHYAESKTISIKKSYDKNLSLISVDPSLVGIIFQNLLTNSIKYSDEGTSVDFEIKKKGDEVIFIVSDTGCGIAHDEQDKIFTKLFRTDNAKNIDPEGSGLGLYVVKAIVEKSGGRIWFDSELGKGSTFYVTLPLSGMPKDEAGPRLISS